MSDPIRDLLYRLFKFRAPVREDPDPVLAPQAFVPPIVRSWGAGVRVVRDGIAPVKILCENGPAWDGIAASRYLDYVERTHRCRNAHRLPHLTETT